MRSKQEADCQGHVSATVKWRERNMNTALLDCERERPEQRELAGNFCWSSRYWVIRAQSQRMVLKGQRKKRIQEAENESAGACMEWAWRWNPFRNSMPGSRVGARVVSRVSTLLATVGKLGRLASLGGRPQTLSSGCGTLGIQWPWVEVLQPGAHHTWRQKRKLQFCPLPSPAPQPEDELKPSGIPLLLNTPVRPSPPASWWMIRLSSSSFSPLSSTLAFSPTQPDCHQGS